MSRPITFTADTKNDDGALSVSPSLGVSVGVESGPAPAAEEVIAASREDLPAANPGGIVACETPTEEPCDNPSDWNGDAQLLGAPLEKEVEETNDAALSTSVPVPVVPKHQGLPSFAQSEFYTVDMILFYFYFEIHLCPPSIDFEFASLGFALFSDDDFSLSYPL
jgi:hypothetical protein